MEAENHLFEKDNHLPNLHFWVPCSFSGVYPFFLNPLDFGGGEISTNRQIHLRSLEAFAGLKRFQFRVLVCTVPGPRTKV